jgi:hypothetical protein
MFCAMILILDDCSGWAVDLRKHIGSGCRVRCHSWAIGSSDNRRGDVEGVFG